MAATSRFEEVLSSISNSKLNFSIYKTPFSAQISLKNSFAKYFKENEEHDNVTRGKVIDTEQINLKSEPVKLEERKEIIEEKDNFKDIMVTALKEIDMLRKQNGELESRLKESKKESKKYRQRVVKLQAMLEKINKEPNEPVSDSSEDVEDANIETRNKFSLLSKSPSEQSFSEPPNTKDQQVQTEVIFTVIKDQSMKNQ